MSSDSSPVIEAVSSALPLPPAVSLADHDLCLNDVIDDQDIQVECEMRGRKLAPIWALFTDDVQPQLHVSSRCKHCNQNVNYHKKSKQVQAHLNRGVQFKTLMGTIIIIWICPFWFSTRNLKQGCQALKATFIA